MVIKEVCLGKLGKEKIKIQGRGEGFQVTPDWSQIAWVRCCEGDTRGLTKTDIEESRHLGPVELLRRR